MMNRKIITSALAALLAASVLSGCGSSGSASYRDGTYEGKSEVYINEEEGSEEGNGYGVATITIKDGKIAECTYQTFEPDGTLKDEEYGKEGGQIANKDYYRKAQKAVGACDEYAAKLVEAGSLKGVDAISGATINYNEFQEAVKAALDQAKS